MPSKVFSLCIQNLSVGWCLHGTLALLTILSIYGNLRLLIFAMLMICHSYHTAPNYPHYYHSSQFSFSQSMSLHRCWGPRLVKSSCTAGSLVRDLGSQICDKTTRKTPRWSSLIPCQFSKVSFQRLLKGKNGKFLTVQPLQSQVAMPRMVRHRIFAGDR